MEQFYMYITLNYHTKSR